MSTVKRPASYREPTELEQVCLTVRAALSSLRLTGNTDLALLEAQAYLEEWLAEHDPRWPR